MLNRLPPCFLCTEDPSLERSVTAHVKDLVSIQTVTDTHELMMMMKQFDPALLLLDLNTLIAREQMASLFEDFPDALILVFGTPRTLPAQNAEAMGAYAVIEHIVDRQHLQTLVRHALDHHKLVEQNRLLKMQVSRIVAQTSDPANTWPPTPTASDLFAQAFRFFDNPDLMIDTMAHGLVACAKASRVLLFAYNDDTDAYHCRAAVNGLKPSLETVVHADAPLVRHLKLTAHAICRTRLADNENGRDTIFLKQALDTMGAEIIVPMQAHHSLTGWVALGHHITGKVYSQHDLESIVPLVDQVAMALSSQLLLARTRMQKALAENVFHAMPVGVVAVGTQGLVHWINNTGATFFDVTPEQVIKKPVTRLSNLLGDLLLRCIDGTLETGTAEWNQEPGNHPLQVSLSRMMNANQCVGALAVLRDMTEENKLRRKEAELERQTFWTGLAAAMSHEIRNPLVAISTFAQLLPERYGDAEFREEFSKLVSQEVSRLNGIVDQISDFAEHAVPVLKPIPIDDLIQNAIRSLERDFRGISDKIEILTPSPVPPVKGDAHSLTECLAHVIRNAAEAIAGQPEPQIRILVTAELLAESASWVQIIVSDNGPGIPENILRDIFSPFCTTKARGIGIGLAVAQRTLFDHNGTISMTSDSAGTRQEIRIPAAV